jgi:hypothetical protein
MMYWVQRRQKAHVSTRLAVTHYSHILSRVLPTSCSSTPTRRVMSTPDLRTRNKISLSPATVLSSSYAIHFSPKSCAHGRLIRVFRQLLPQVLASNALLTFALNAGKEWLLDYDIGIFWVLMRMLACGGLTALIYQLVSGNISPKRSIEVGSYSL